MLTTIAKQLGRNILTNKRQILQATTANMSGKSGQFETLAVTVPKPNVYHVQLNRPDKLNAFNNTMWHEIGSCFDYLSMEADCRAIVLSAAGKLFTAGIDLNSMMSLGQELAEHEDVARKAKVLSQFIKRYQDSITSLEICNKPVIAAVHGPCVGAGVDLVSTADIRYCSNDAWFQVKEVDIGMAADVGTLQRLPKVIGSDSLVRELCYTARKFHAPEALTSGFVSKVFENKDTLVSAAVELAVEIASKSPVAVQGTKMNLVYSRDHTVQQGLDQIGIHNKMALQSEDFLNAVMGQATKQKNVVFSKL